MSDPFDELQAVFAEEARELVAQLDRSMVRLESLAKGPERDALVREVFRVAHTLKGAAATAGRDDIAEVAHALESALEQVRQGQLEPLPELTAAALGALDLLKAAAERRLPVEPVRAAIDRLARATVQEAPTRPSKRPRASAPRARASAPRADASVAPPPATPRAAAPAEPGPSLEALAEQLTAMVATPTLEQAETVRQAAALLLARLPPSEISASVVGAVEAAFTTAGGADLTRLAEAGFLAADLLHGLSQGAGSAPEAGAVERALKAARTARETKPVAAPEPVQASVRVQISTLDGLHYRAEELVAVKLRLDFERQQVEEARAALGTKGAAAKDAVRTLARRLDVIHAGLAREVHLLDLLSQGLHQDLNEVRMVPVALALDPLHRTVRDLAQSTGREVQLEVEGEGTRVDKHLLELIRDPLAQLIRNAVAHGIESPPERLGAGKPARGRLKVAVESRESQVFIEVQDDGRGIDEGRLKTEAVRRGILDARAAQALSRREALNLVFAPGLSTSERVTDLAGRGVGLDVVRENVSRLGGRIEFFTEAGRGTRFVLCLPLTMAASRGMMVAAGRSIWCLPLTAVEEVQKVAPGAFGQAQGRLAMSWRHQAITYAGLEELLSGAPAVLPTGDTYVVVLALSDRRLALGVGQLLGQQEMVLKAPAPGTPPLRFVAGTTTTADGRLVTVLDPTALVEAAAVTRPVAPSAARRATVLVVDDALTSRTLISSLLEQRGYRAVVAHDGEAAWAALARERVNLVVSDVEMPNLDGFGLTTRIRGSAELSELPVILLTSLDDAESRVRGSQAGANAYVVKSKFEPGAFLSLVTQLAGEHGA